MPRKTKDIKDEEINKEKNTKNTAKKTTKNVIDVKVAKEKKETTKKKTETAKKENVATKPKTTKTKKASISSTKTKKATSKKDKIDKTNSKTTTNKKTTKKVSSKTTSNKKQKANLVEYYDLPNNYNKTIVKVLAQTPKVLFVYWEISLDDINRFKKQYGDNFFETTKPVLIVHNDSINYSFEVEINDFANSWYLHVNDTKSNYRIEIGRKPIPNVSNINENYIYISSSNEIETPNDKILFDKSQKMVYFRNTKTNIVTRKDISISFIKNIGKIYNIYDLYKEIYSENIDELYNLSNPSSRNPSSESLSSKFM